MTSAVGAAASASAEGQRSSHASQRGTTRAVCVCWSITSETRIAYGSRVRRHGRSRPCSPYQRRSSLTRETLDSAPVVCFELDSSPPIPLVSGASVCKQDELGTASEDAWQRVLDFIERHGR